MFLKRRWVYLTIAVVVAVGAALELEFQWVPPGRGRPLALALTALVAAVIFVLTQVVVPIWNANAHVRHGSKPSRRLPERLVSFVGRQEQLDVLLRRHASQRLEPGRRRPLKLLIHGMPGVGKSALGQELAYMLADQYPDGQLYVKMGTASERRDSGELLGVFLRHLGRTDDLPTSTEDRIKLFRSATAGKRLLIVLDGARDEDQVKDVLPSEARCTVIVSSRRNLGPALDERSLWLKPPSALEAAKIVREYLSTEDLASAEVVASVANMCSNIPMALRAACELARQADEGLAEVAARLEAPRRRLEHLAVPGRDLNERIMLEYKRLLPQERSALSLLALVRTRTFVPWVLQPLLDIGPREASYLMTALSIAEFVGVSAPDPSGFVRYELNDLVRIFAEDRLEDEIPEANRVAAIKRFNRAMLACSMTVLDLLDGVSRAEPVILVPNSWMPDIPGWERRVAQEAEFWINAEFRSLADAVLDAHDSDAHEVCWRITQRFDHFVETDADSPEVLRAFEVALKAARLDNETGAASRVELAYGTHLLAVGEYHKGFDLLDDVSRRSDGGQSMSAMARLYAGQTLQRLGQYARSSEELALARRLASSGDQASVIHLIDVLLATNRAVTTPSGWLDDIAASTPRPDGNRGPLNVHALVAFAESAMRRAAWHEALTLLDEASEGSKSHEGLSAYVVYKRASVLVRQAALYNDDHRTDLTTSAIDLAACAVATYQVIRNVEGELRSRALLAEAYLVAGQPLSSLEQVDKAWSRVNNFSPDFSEEYGWAIAGELNRLEGQARSAGQEYSLARAPLDRAIELFGKCQMFWDRARTQLILGRVLCRLELHTRALCVLYAALVRFDECGDGELVSNVLREIEQVYSSMPRGLVPKLWGSDPRSTRRGRVH